MSSLKVMSIFVFAILSLYTMKPVCGDDFERFLLVAGGRDIIQVGLNNDRYIHRQLDLTGYSNIVALDFDYQDRMVYWTDVNRNILSRCFLDGTHIEVIASDDVSVPDGLALDVVNRKVYWTDTGTNRIERANLNGSSREVVVTRDLDQPRTIVIDSIDSLLYWTDWGSSPKVEVSNLDGSERRALVTTGLTWPNGLVLDKPDAKLYWCDAGTNNIEVYDLITGTRHTLLNLPDSHFFGVAIVGDYIFWTDWNQNRIGRADKTTGANQMSVGNELPGRLGDIHFYGGMYCDIEGTWYNSLGDELKLERTSNGMLLGEYRTAYELFIGYNIDLVIVVGYCDVTELFPTFGFSVVRNHGEETISWTGQCHLCDNAEVLMTNWISTEQTKICLENAQASKVGRDKWTRYTQSLAPKHTGSDLIQ